jgi:cytoskeletal protein CcmA (bactofilin family)
MGNGTFGWQQRAIGERAADSEVSAPAAADQLSTFFADGCNVDGKLIIKTSIEIGGEFRGALESEQTVTVAADASVDGSIRARSVCVVGAVVGEIEASRELIIQSTGRVHGDVTTPSLVIERGAFFNGQTRMYRPEVVARTGQFPETPAESQTTAERIAND